MTRRALTRQILRYIVVGVLNNLTTWGAVWALRLAGVAVGTASASAYAIAAVQGYLLSRYWTFAGAGHSLAPGSQFIGFAAVNGVCALIFARLNIWLHQSLSLPVSTVLATLLVMPVSFALYKLLVFRVRTT